MLTIGIDPGLEGAVALLNRDGQEELVADLPAIRDGKLAWIDGGALHSMLLEAIHGRPCRVMIERVSARPEQGVSSSFVFGVGFGSVLSVLQVLRLPIEFVQPSTWKAALGLKKKKQASLDKARLLFPSADLTLKKHDGRAEALLIAYYAQMKRRAGT